MFKLIVVLLVISRVRSWNPFKKEDKKWSCVVVQDDLPLTPSNTVFWRKENCTQEADGVSKPVAVNSLHIDLTKGDVKIVPGYSQDAAAPLIPINKIAESYGPDAKFIAGVNGGYFWRTDITGFWFDDVCRGKTRKQAETPVDDCTAHPDNGLHDGSLIVDGKSVGCNCNNWGYSRPALMATTEGNSEWNIKVMSRGEQAAAGVKFALAAGPNLVSYDPVTGQSKVDIPDGEDNINRFEHAAQTAVGINFASAGVANKITMVTTDGCEYSSKCGVADPNLALLMQQHFGCQQAMSMDQGGSTTMWVRDATKNTPDQNGVVSNAGGSARNVANGLFVVVA